MVAPPTISKYEMSSEEFSKLGEKERNEVLDGMREECRVLSNDIACTRRRTRFVILVGFIFFAFIFFYQLIR